jgi:hypothetical protein
VRTSDIPASLHAAMSSSEGEPETHTIGASKNSFDRNSFENWIPSMTGITRSANKRKSLSWQHVEKKNQQNQQM